MLWPQESRAQPLAKTALYALALMAIVLFAAFVIADVKLHFFRTRHCLIQLIHMLCCFSSSIVAHARGLVEGIFRTGHRLGHEKGLAYFAWLCGAVAGLVELVAKVI